MEENMMTLDWKFSRIPNNKSGYVSDGGKVVAYTTVSDEFAEALNKLLDGGSALITNTIKALRISTIDNVDRSGNIVTVSFINDINVWNTLDDKLGEVLNALFDVVNARLKIGLYSENVAGLFPIYSSGNAYKPDGMNDIIKEVCIGLHESRKGKDIIYCITFHASAFSKIVLEYEKYFRYVFKDIFKCKEAFARENSKDILIIDGGDKTSVEKANALGCAAMYIALQIIDLWKLKETYNA